MAVVQGAPIRVGDALMDRLAEAVRDGDLEGPFLRRVPTPTAASGAHAGESPGSEPRNLAFADGLDGWDLNGSFFRDSTGSHWNDYFAQAARGRGAVLAAAVPGPYGFAALEQAIFAAHYRGQAVSFRGVVRTDGVRDRAALYLRTVVDGPVGGRARAPSGNTLVLTRVGSSQDWTRHEAAALR